MMVRTIPASVKYNPFLKMVVLGINIQKDDMTKKSSEIPKKTFKKNNGFLVLALCKLVSFCTKYGAVLFIGF